jgi:hypothetical protein
MLELPRAIAALKWNQPVHTMSELQMAVTHKDFRPLRVVLRLRSVSPTQRNCLGKGCSYTIAQHTMQRVVTHSSIINPDDGAVKVCWNMEGRAVPVWMLCCFTS